MNNMNKHGIERSELVRALQHMAKERLTTKQRQILLFLSELGGHVPITRLVEMVREVLHCSETAVWNNVRQLQRMEVIQCGDQNKKGMPVTLTKIGKILTQQEGIP
jgi:biotin operon repressor